MNSKKIVLFLLKLTGPIIIIISWYLSSKATIPHMPSFWSSDKLIHCICFAGLAGAWTFWFSPLKWNKNFKQCFFICIAIIAVYGTIDEIHQSFVPGRFPSFFDWLFDILGGIIGTLAGRFIIIKSKFFRN